MNAERLRTYIPDLKDQRILNISYMEGERYAVIPMLAKKDEKLCLWELSGISEEAFEHRHRRYRKRKTNRASLKENLKGHDTLRIKALELDGQRFEVKSASGICLGDECNLEEQVLLLYMLHQGVKLGKLEQAPFNRLMINTYELVEEGQREVREDIAEEKNQANELNYTNEVSQTEESEQSDESNQSGGRNATTESDKLKRTDNRNSTENPVGLIDYSCVTIELSGQHIPIPLHKKLRLKTGEYAKPRVIHVTGEAEAAVYIHGITFYDIWEESKTRFEDERYKERFTAEQIEQMKKTYMESLPKMCPKGCVLPVIEYECDKDYQMQFYTTEYLKREPEHSSSSVFMMMRPEKKIGPMGCRNQACLLEAVEKGFEGDIAVELFACYKKIPEKLITGKLL